MAARRNTRTQNQNIPTFHPGGLKRPLETDDGLQGNQRKKRVFGDITNRDNAQPTDISKRTVKKASVTKKDGKIKTVVAVPKNRKTTCKLKEDADVLKSSQNSVKSGDVSWDILELSQESKSSQNSSSSQSSSADSQLEDPFKHLILSEDARKYLQASADQIDDIDTENMKDPYQCALYSHYIFNYYKQREVKFVLADYLQWQTDLTPHMRGILVDWLVEVQENFELNHETLYLAIKLVDLYLNKNMTSKDRLQLVGATALFIACKFDERCPPILDDFLYICDDAYRREELIAMEQKILRSIDFDLGIPLSYRFLRRYAKCARSSILTLTLARYILETSQMDYSFVQMVDSYRSAACLLLAMKMDGSGSWSRSMVYYTGYTEEELLPLVRQLNTMVAAQPTSKLTTIRVKYSHKVFHEVAKIPSVVNLDLSSSAISPDCEL